MSKLRVGIAGYGVVGKRRREIIDQHPALETIAVCDQNITQPGFLGHASSGKKVATFSNYRELLDQDLDLLFVCLPNYLAAQVTIAGLERNLHVFCEKPPSRNIPELRRVIAVEAQRPELVLKYGFNHRYHDSVREALKFMHSGNLGKVINAHAVYGKSAIIPFSGGWRAERKYAGGGILLDQGIHMVDLLRLFCGEFCEVKSFVSNKFWKHNVEDNAYAIMQTKSGVVAMLHSSATQWRHRFKLEITLERGMLILSGILSGSKSYGAETFSVVYASDNDKGDPREVKTRYNEDPSWRDEIYEFADSVINKQPIVFGTSKDALLTMQLVFDIYAADKEWTNLYPEVNDQIDQFKLVVG